MCGTAVTAGAAAGSVGLLDGHLRRHAAAARRPRRCAPEARTATPAARAGPGRRARRGARVARRRCRHRATRRPPASNTAIGAEGIDPSPRGEGDRDDRRSSEHVAHDLDAVVLWHVLEHVPDPAAARHAYARLAAAGRCPDRRRPEPRVAPGADRRACLVPPRPATAPHALHDEGLRSLPVDARRFEPERTYHLVPEHNFHGMWFALLDPAGHDAGLPVSPAQAERARAAARRDAARRRGAAPAACPRSCSSSLRPRSRRGGTVAVVGRTQLGRRARAAASRKRVLAEAARPLQRRRSGALARGRVLAQRAHPLGERGGVAARHAALSPTISGSAAGARGDHGHPGGHRLERGVTERLVARPRARRPSPRRRAAGRAPRSPTRAEQLDRRARVRLDARAARASAARRPRSAAARRRARPPRSRPRSPSPARAGRARARTRPAAARRRRRAARRAGSWRSPSSRSAGRPRRASCPAAKRLGRDEAVDRVEHAGWLAGQRGRVDGGLGQRCRGS